MARGFALFVAIVLHTTAAVGASPDPHCGANCIYVASKALADRPSAYADVEKSLGSPGPRGYSMGQLADYAKGLGLETLGVKTTLERLQRRRRPFACIGLIDETHFVLVSDVDQSQVHVFDPPKSYSVAHDTFNRSWDGECLLLSTMPLQAEAELDSWGNWWIWPLGATGGLLIVLMGWRWFTDRGTGSKTSSAIARGTLILCGLSAFTGGGCDERLDSGPPRVRLSPASVDLGEVVVSEGLASTRQIELTVENLGWKNLKINRVESSCGCAIAQVSNPVVHPKQAIRIKIDAQLVAGVDRETTVTVWSNDPNRPYAQAKLSWRAVAPLRFEPPSIEIGSILPGEVRIEKVRLIAADESTLDLLAAAKIESTSKEVRAEPVNEQGAHQGREREFQILLTGGQETGLHSATVRVAGETTDVGRSVFIRWKIEPQLEVSPEAVLIGSGMAGEKRTRKLVLTAREGSKLVLGETGFVEASDLLAVDSRAINERAAILDLNVTLPETPGLHRWELAIDVQEPRVDTIKVPVTAYVLAPAAKGS